MKTDAAPQIVQTESGHLLVEPYIPVARVISTTHLIGVHPMPNGVQIFGPSNYELTYEQVAQLRDQLDYVLSNRPTEGTV